jgi:hypothetical protein
MAKDLTDDNELGFDIDFESAGNNIFETFHKQNSNKDDNPDDNPDDDNPDDDVDDIDDKNDKSKNPKATGKSSKNKDDDNDDPDKIKFDTDPIQDMIKRKAKGEAEPDDDDDDIDPADKTKKTDKTVKTNKDGTPVVPAVVKAFYDHLTEEAGYRPIDKEDGFDGTVEGFQKWMATVHEEQATELAESMIEEAFINNPNPRNKGMAQELFKFMQKGGAVEDFIQIHKDDDITADFITKGKDDDEKTERAKKVMINYYKSLNWDATRIEKNIKTLETSGALIDVAEDNLPEFLKLKEERKAIIERNAEQQTSRTKAQITEYNTKLVEIIDKSDSIGPFEFKNKAQRQKVKEFMFLPTVELEDGRKVPQYMVELDKARRNPTFALFQALTFMNKGLDLDNVKEKAATKTKLDLKKRLEDAVAGNKIERTPSSSVANRDESRTKIKDLFDFDNIAEQFAP